MSSTITPRDIELFVQCHSGLSRPVRPDEDLWAYLKIDGDDYFDLVEDFSATFKVDTSDWCWYFHCRDEGSCISFPSFAGLFTREPWQQVQHIPITPADLLCFAQSGRWDIHYPAHKIRQYPWARWLNLCVWAGIILALISLLHLTPTGDACKTVSFSQSSSP